MFRPGKTRNLLNHLAYLKQERGAIFVMFALLLPVTLGFLGFAYDVGNLYIHRARLQNVTDAAALAGGEVFKNPPEKTEATEDGEYVSTKTGKVVKLVNNEEVVVKEIQKVDYKVGTSIKERADGGNTITTNSPNHPQADAVARDYIAKNSINLGNVITTEEMSALGYKGINTTTVNGKPSTTGSVTTTINTETKKDTDAVYYRIIASEEVPLYFLPVIMDKKVQTVRTTSIAVLDNTTETIKTTTTITNSNYVPDPSGGKTILDNLFTFSDGLYIPNKFGSDDPDGSVKSINNIKSTFSGDIVYTNDSANIQMREQIEILKKLFPGTETLDEDNLSKIAYELVDHMHYAILNESINIGSTEYLTAFKSPFFESDGETYKTTAIPMAWTSGQNTEVSEINKIIKNAQKVGDDVNVFYDSNTSGGSNTLLIDEAIVADKNGSTTKPVYFLFSSMAGRGTCHITVNCKMERPIVIVWLQNGGENLTIGGTGEFHGVIYAPFKQVNAHTGGFSFLGNIIASKIDIQADGQKYKMVNYLKNENDFRNLTTISAPGSNLTQAQYDTAFTTVLQSLIDGTDEDRRWKGKTGNQWYQGSFERSPISKEIFEWIKDNYTNTTGDSGIQDLTSNTNRTQIVEAWIIAYEKTLAKLAEDYKNQNFQLSDLNKISKFPWDENYTPGGNPGGSSTQNSTKTDTKIYTLPTQFRLINPRTETNPYFKANTDDI